MQYPLDYQLALGRILRERLAASTGDAAAMHAALCRLAEPNFGACTACGALIDYLDLVADPAASHCRGCGG